MSNVLALPLVHMSIETGNNEDWVDSIKYVVDNADGTAIDDMPQLDLRGITFEMEIRREASDNEVILAASIVDGTLAIGVPPNIGFLLINIPLVEMQNHATGTYVGDITARDDINTRVTIQLDLTIVEGVTKRPVNQRIAIAA